LPTLAGQQAGRRIEPDPAGAGNVDFRPGMQVGEIVVGALRTVQRDEIRLQLDQVAGHEARGETEMAKRLHQEPARIAAGAGDVLERLLRRLHAGLHADHIADLAGNAGVEVDDEINRADALAGHGIQKTLEQRSRRFGLAVDGEVRGDVIRILERPMLGRILDEEIEGIVDRHVGDEADLDLQLLDRLRKDETRQPVAVRVLLVVHEVL
jgi:hypothetical protein